MDWWFERDFKIAGCTDAGGTGTCPCGTSGELLHTNVPISPHSFVRLVEYKLVPQRTSHLACCIYTDSLISTQQVIGIPRLVGQACLLLNTTLTPTQLANCTHITARSFDVFQRPTMPNYLVGANVLDIASIGIALGLLTQNASAVADAYERVRHEVQVVSGFQADGVLEDGSFGQHEGLLYNGAWGGVCSVLACRDGDNVG